MTTPGTAVFSSLTTEYVIVPVNAVDDGVVISPTSDAVQFAFTIGYGIKPTVWYGASWDPNPVQGIWYNAKCLIGPSNGGVVLIPGTYTVWVKVTSNPQIPVKQAGTIVVQ